MRISDWSSDVCSSDLSHVVPNLKTKVGYTKALQRLSPAESRSRLLVAEAGRLVYNPRLLMRGGAVWQLVGLITRRSQVQILPPLPAFRGRRKASTEAFFDGDKSGLVEARFMPRRRNPVVSDKGPIGPLVAFRGRPRDTTARWQKLPRNR